LQVLGAAASSYNRPYNQRHTRLQIGAYAVGVVEFVNELSSMQNPGAHLSRYDLWRPSLDRLPSGKSLSLRKEKMMNLFRETRGAPRARPHCRHRLGVLLKYKKGASHEFLDQMRRYSDMLRGLSFLQLIAQVFQICSATSRAR
jgi:hypothetical protein